MTVLSALLGWVAPNLVRLTAFRSLSCPALTLCCPLGPHSCPRRWSIMLRRFYSSFLVHGCCTRVCSTRPRYTPANILCQHVVSPKHALLSALYTCMHCEHHMQPQAISGEIAEVEREMAEKEGAMQPNGVDDNRKIRKSVSAKLVCPNNTTNGF